ncbi:serine hydrolase FSH [Halenospora varia]|nr:serine hydrolase FSH [Halenospora varia]
MTQPLSSPLPSILCLHGHGTNSTIFRYQTRHITTALTQTFNFIFINAPFTVENAGPGALPTFADVKPFRRWNCGEIAASVFGVSDEEVEEERRKVRGLFKEAIEQNNVVGIMAFSHGGRVATGLLLDQELAESIKFVVMICGAFPALLLAEEAPFDLQIDTPSIHVQGTRDPWKSQSTKLLESHFKNEKAKIIKFNGGHEVPGGVKEAGSIVEEVRTVWTACSSSGEI